MPTSLTGRSIIVTGAGRGIGEAMARGLATEGARLAIADIDGDNAQSVAAQIGKEGGTAIGLSVDVTRRESISTMIDATIKAFGRLDVIFNNAGIAQTCPFLEITEQDWQRVMDVNALGVLLCMQEAAKRMIQQGGGGKIVNTGAVCISCA